MAHIHDRMPVILARLEEGPWLDADAPVEAALTPLDAFPADLMIAEPIGTGVGNVRNNSPELLAPTGPALAI